jgi:hypothetical protein
MSTLRNTETVCWFDTQPEVELSVDELERMLEDGGEPAGVLTCDEAGIMFISRPELGLHLYCTFVGDGRWRVRGMPAVVRVGESSGTVDG